MSDPRVVVVMSPHQNVFFPELAEVLVDELLAAGCRALVTVEPGMHEVQPDDVFVLVPPHEYTGLEGSAFVDDPLVAARTVGLSAEQPHQQFFVRNAELGARLGAVLDFSPLAVEAYRRLGVDARHLPFGYTSRWDRYAAGPVPSGPPRVLYLGNKRPRRLSRLAAAAEVLAREDARLLISDNEVPNLASGPTFVAGDDKRDLLASTRLLVNIHQGDEPYFEWLRFAEAAHCGTPVLSEQSVHTEPFVAGTDFAEFADGGLGDAIEALIDDDTRLVELAASAYERLRARPLADAVGIVMEAASGLLAAPPPPALPTRTRVTALGAERSGPRVDDRTGLEQVRRLRFRKPPPRFTVLGHDPQLVVDALAGWPGFDPVASIEPDRLHARDARRLDDGFLVIAPAGCRPRQRAFERLLRAATTETDPVCWSGIVDGVGVDGEQTLEGIWPWEPWRLRAGQHLGRLVVVPTSVVRAAAAWFDDAALRSHPHVLVHAWVALHGGTGGHLATPVAQVIGTSLDPAQHLPDRVAERVASLLPA